MEKAEQSLELIMEDKGERQGPHSPSVDNLFSNRDVLERRLSHRSNREDLVSRGIIPASNTNLAAQITQLERAKTQDFLHKKIRARPSKQQLIQRHILADSKADASLQGRQAVLERKRIADHLNEQLFNRPGPIELIKDNILVTDPVLAEAVKQGCIDFHATTEDSWSPFSGDPDIITDLFNVLSPNKADQIDSFAQEFSANVKVESNLHQTSECQPLIQQFQQQFQSLHLRGIQHPQAGIQYSQETQRTPLLPQHQQHQQFNNQKILDRPQDPHASLRNQTAGDDVKGRSPIEQPLQSQLEKHFVLRKNFPLQLQSKNKGTGPKSPKVPKKKQAKPQQQPKFKKHKFHEYKPPNAPEANNKIDNRYHRLLKQQTLFLQLQVQQQNAMLAALHDAGSDTAKGMEDSKYQRERSSSSLSSTSTTSPQGSGALDDMRVSELRFELKSRGLPVSGCKAKLLERLRSYEDSKVGTDLSGQLKQTALLAAVASSVQIRSKGESTRGVSVNTNSKSNTILQVTTYATANGQTFQVVQAVPNVRLDMQPVLPDGRVLSDSQVELSPFQMEPLSIQNMLLPSAQANSAVQNVIPSSPQHQQQQQQQQKQQLSSDIRFLHHIVPSRPVDLQFSAPIVTQTAFHAHHMPSGKHSSPAELESFHVNGTTRNCSVTNSALTSYHPSRSPLMAAVQNPNTQNNIVVSSNMQLVGMPVSTNLLAYSAGNVNWLKEGSNLSQSVPSAINRASGNDGIGTKSKPDASDSNYLRLKSYPWTNPPVQVPCEANNGSSFVMFKMKPDGKRPKGQMSVEHQNNRRNATQNTTGGNDLSDNGKEADYLDNVMSHYNTAKLENILSTIPPVGLIMNNNSLIGQNLVKEIPQMSASMPMVTASHGSSKNDLVDDNHEDLLNILGELSKSLDKGPTNAGSSGPAKSQMLSSPTLYSLASQSFGNMIMSVTDSRHPTEGKVKNQLLSSSSVALGKGFNSWPKNMNRVGGADESGSTLGHLDQGIRRGIKLEPDAPSPMQIEEDSVAMEIDNVSSMANQGNLDLEWLDLSFSPSSSPQVPSQLSPKHYAVHMQQSKRDLHPSQNMLSTSTFLDTPQRSNDLVSSLFDMSEAQQPVIMAFDLHDERWDIF